MASWVTYLVGPLGEIYDVHVARIEKPYYARLTLGMHLCIVTPGQDDRKDVGIFPESPILMVATCGDGVGRQAGILEQDILLRRSERSHQFLLDLIPMERRTLLDEIDKAQAMNKYSLYVARRRASTERPVKVTTSSVRTGSSSTVHVTRERVQGGKAVRPSDFPLTLPSGCSNENDSSSESLFRTAQEREELPKRRRVLLDPITTGSGGVGCTATSLHATAGSNNNNNSNTATSSCKKLTLQPTGPDPPGKFHATSEKCNGTVG